MSSNCPAYFDGKAVLLREICINFIETHLDYFLSTAIKTIQKSL